MLTINNEQIDFFSKNNYLIISNALSTNDINGLKEYARQLYSENSFKAAGIGKSENFQINTDIRSDLIYWIPDYTQEKNELIVLEFFEQLKNLLNKSFYISLKSFESHFAFYKKKSFYKKHVDSFQNNNKRFISCVLYLNEIWEESDGGQLRLYLGEKITDITPNLNTLVLFRSNIVEHEVLNCNQVRLSICAWLKN
jgi:SM-20-related protein